MFVAGKDGQGRGWVLADASGRYPPAEWAKTAIAADRAHRADRVIAEVNNGGEMVEATLRVIDPNMPFRAARPLRRLMAADCFCAASCDQQRSFGNGCGFQ